MNMQPRVEFRFSDVYDEQIRIMKNADSYPDPATTKVFLGRLEREWRTCEEKVFSAIAECTGISWTDLYHVCYVVGSASPFSDPLTMPVFMEKVPIDYAADVLTHELIHRNLIQSSASDRVQRVMHDVRTRYVSENENVVIHVIVHAVHDVVFRRVFTVARLEREKRVMSSVPDYRRAWDIVDAVGAETLVRDFFEKKKG